MTRPCYLVDLRTLSVPTANQIYFKLGNPYISWGSEDAPQSIMSYENVHANGGTMLTWDALATLNVGELYEFTVKGLGQAST